MVHASEWPNLNELPVVWQVVLGLIAVAGSTFLTLRRKVGGEHMPTGDALRDSMLRIEMILRGIAEEQKRAIRLAEEHIATERDIREQVHTLSEMLQASRFQRDEIPGLLRDIRLKQNENFMEVNRTVHEMVAALRRSN